MQHELLPRLGIDVGYFRRWFGNFQVTQLRGLTAADFDRYQVTAPADSRLPDGGGYVINELYNVNPARVGVGTTYTTLARDFGDQSEYWNGVDFSANARLQNGVMLQGGISTGRTDERQLRRHRQRSGRGLRACRTRSRAEPARLSRRRRRS